MFLATLSGGFVINARNIKYLEISRDKNNYLIVAHLSDGDDFTLDKIPNEGKSLSGMLSEWVDYLNGKTATRPY